MLGPNVSVCNQVGCARGGFTPSSISGLKLWLKADTGLYQERTGASATTPASADSDPVGSWLDQSGQGNHATASSDSVRPTLKLAIQNGLPVLRADGTDDLLLTGNYTRVQPRTLFLVVRQRTWVIGARIASAVTGGFSALLAYQSPTSASIRMYSGASGPMIDVGTASFALLTCVFNGASSEMRLNGGSAVTGNAGSTLGDGMYLGGVPGACSGADLCEVLDYDGVLSTTDRQSVEAYLNARWGVY